METFQFYFELIGAAAFAISGAALGIRKEMDLFGVAMLGMTTAVGGGMLRDTMLGLTPPTALRDPVQALVAIAVSILVFFVWRRRKAELHNRYAETVLLLADSLGLGIFSAHGAAIAIQAGYGANWFLVLFMGMLTGVGGGVLRDVCSAERPYIFTKHVYACASLAGAAVCLLLWPLGAGAAMMTGCGVTLALRICAAAFRWSLPAVFCAVRLRPMMPAGSNPAKMRRAAVTGSRNAAMPAITAPGASPPARYPAATDGVSTITGGTGIVKDSRRRTLATAAKMWYNYPSKYNRNKRGEP